MKTLKYIALTLTAFVSLLTNNTFAAEKIRFQLPYFQAPSDRSAFISILEIELSDFELNYAPNGTFGNRPRDVLAFGGGLIMSCGGYSLNSISNEFAFISSDFVFENENEWRRIVNNIPSIEVDNEIITSGIFGSPFMLLSTVTFPSENKNEYLMRSIRPEPNIASAMGYKSVRMSLKDLLIDNMLAKSFQLQPTVQGAEVSTNVFRKTIDEKYLEGYKANSETKRIKKYISEQGMEYDVLGLFSHMLETQHRFTNNTFCMEKSWVEGLSESEKSSLLKGLRKLAFRWNVYIAKVGRKHINEKIDNSSLKTYSFGGKTLSEAMFARRKGDIYIHSQNS